MARAQGARSQLAAAFETVYGTAPVSGFKRMPFAASTLSAEQPLLSSELLGYGRDPLAPIKDAITSDGDLTIPIDAESFGFWLKAAFGNPTTTGPSAAVAATGTIAFSGNPTAGDTITIGGVIWTFVASGATGPQTEIDNNLAATLSALVVDLNASANSEISKATYSNPGGTDDLLITFDIAGEAGNAFTIAASAATASGPRLTGGVKALYTHNFHSGNWTLPSMSIETGMPEVPRYAMYTGVMVDQLSWTMQRSGLLTASAQFVAQGETVAASSQAGSPTDYDLVRFGHFNGSIKREGVSLGNVISAQITYANNLDRIETIRNDGMIDGADPSIAALTGNIEVRFADMVLVNQAIAGTPCELEFAYTLVSGESLTVTVHAVYLPRPRLEISGPQGVQATFDWQAAKAASPARMATVTLVNNIEEY